MQSTISEENGLQRKIKISVDTVEVNQAFEEFYLEAQKHAVVKGFRKGHVPLDQVKSMYVAQAAQQVVQDLVNQYYRQSIMEHKLNPVGNPAFDLEELKEDSSFEFSVTVEVRPEIVLKKYKGLKIKKETLRVDAKALEKVMHEILKGQSEQVPVLEDRPAALGDVAQIDFEGFLEGAPFEGGKGEDHKLELGSKSFIEGFEEGIVGMKVGGTAELKLKFPQEYHSTQLAGQEVVFKVKLKALLKMSLPNLDDDFAKGMGCKDLSDLKEKLKENIQQRESQRIEGELRDQALKALIAENPVEVPEQLHKEQKEDLMNDSRQRLKQSGLPEEQIPEYEKKWADEFEESSKFMIQSAFLIDKIAETHDLFATAEEVKLKMEERAQQHDVPLDQVEAAYQDPARKSGLMYEITQGKVVEFILAEADVSEVAPSKK